MNTQTGNVAVILGHPDAGSLCGALAGAYAEGARAVGATVREIRLGELTFDPVLWHGYGEIQPLEPDLVAAQETISWADTVVFVYPTWWGSVPALLKGFVDRTFLPGFAFKYRENSSLWDRLLAGRDARLIVTMDSPPWYYRWVVRQPGHQMMRRAILGFSGVKPVRTTVFGPVRSSSDQSRGGWLERALALGQQDGRRAAKKAVTRR